METCLQRNSEVQIGRGRKCLLLIALDGGVIGMGKQSGEGQRTLRREVPQENWGSDQRMGGEFRST